MAVASSFFWVLGLVLTVALGPQLRIWTWGGGMLCFGISVLFALPAIWSARTAKGSPVIEFCGALLVVWLGIRALATPVEEAGQSDFLLVAMAVATFVSFRAISQSTNAQRILIAGIALLTLASLVVIIRQLQHPGYSPVFGQLNTRSVTGFYAHYSHGGSFLVVVSCMLGGMALHSKGNLGARAVLGVIALLAVGAVYFTRSRGAVLGAVGGFGMLATYSIILGKRDGKKWFAPAIIATPLIVGGIIFTLISAWSGVQEARNDSTEITAILDNAIRWYLAGIAFSCIGLHPMLGGGARSFSWECYRFWDVESMGQGNFKPEHVHNELLQTVCDYGIIGAALLVVFLTCVLIYVTLSTSQRKSALGTIFADGWRIGGIAGLAGLFFQSNFEGILRIAPGAVLLALCISAACFRRSGDQDVTPRARPWLRPSALLFLGVVAAFSLSMAGTKGIRVSLLLWPSYFGRDANSNENKIDALNKAIAIWPLHSLILQRGISYQAISVTQGTGRDRNDLQKLALADYRRASELHPYDPYPLVNSANIFSEKGQYEEAEAAYAKAVKLQGGMEGAFQSNFYSARHHYTKTMHSYDAANPSAALHGIETAVRNIEEAFSTSWIHGSREDQSLRLHIHEGYGRILGDLGDYKAALKQYDFCYTKPYGLSAHYLAGQLLGKMAVEKWSQRQSEDAMLLFMQALGHALAARDELPENVKPEERDEYVDFLRNRIEYLKGARITPSKSVDY